MIFVPGYFDRLGSTRKEVRRSDVPTPTTMVENLEKASPKEENPDTETNEFGGEFNAEINVS